MSGAIASPMPEEHAAEARRDWVLETFFELAQTFSSDFELMDLLTFISARLVELSHTAEVGLFLCDPTNQPHVLGSSTERIHTLAEFEARNDEGPCLDVLRSGTPVINTSLRDDERWPSFAPRARACGYETVHALPMRHAGRVVGVLHIFDERALMLGDDDLAVAQALADIATFAILQDRALHHASELAEQLQTALASRVVIEQAKGIVAEGLSVEIADAFGVLRTYARNHNQRLDEVARRIVQRELVADELRTGAPSAGRRPTRAHREA